MQNMGPLYFCSHKNCQRPVKTECRQQSQSNNLETHMKSCIFRHFNKAFLNSQQNYKDVYVELANYETFTKYTSMLLCNNRQTP